LLVILLLTHFATCYSRNEGHAQAKERKNLYKRRW